MKSSNKDDHFLTIGEAARIWRVSPDSLRSWARKGVLHPVPTPGGQRRFRHRELATVLGNPGAAAAGGPPGERAPGAAPAPRSRSRRMADPSPPRLRIDPGSGSPEVDVARWELETTRARHETDALRREMEQGRMEVAKREEAERVQREREHRLEGLRAYGRSCAAGLPIEWRQRVISLLQEFVSATNLPLSLPDHEAKALVAAKVGQVRQEYDAQQRRELTEVLGRWGVQRLIESGRDVAARLTESWDPRDAEEARAEVARELARCVESDWTQGEVCRRVEDILARWEEADDDLAEDGEEEDADESDDGELDDEMGW